MNKYEIKFHILDVIRRCNIFSYPIDCFDLLDKCEIKYVAYSSLTKKKREKCFLVSDEAFVLKGIIYYNDSNIDQRIRFSLMHELGHLVLNHSDERTPQEESEANYFSSNILAPRMVIHYSRCKNYFDVMNRFNLSEQAAMIAFDDYRRWYRLVAYKMTKLDKEMYNHFYNENAEKFVWKIKHCEFCYTEDAYNGDDYCMGCKIAEIRKLATRAPYDEQEYNLDILRGHWLYGEL